MSNVLKQAMLTLYRDSPEILYCLQQLDYTSLEVTFQKELDARIDRKTYDEVEKFLASDDYLRYVEAVNSASMSMTRDIAKLIQFVLETKGETH
ncbi:MAG: hypothetical protein [Myoviridae sp. ctThM1]|nr:MAG: hypothetical protein [Myoviridae sp. ctThM1]